MARTLSTDTKTAIYGQQTDEVFIKLLDILIDENADDNWKCIHLTNNPHDIDSTVADGSTTQTYIYVPFQVYMPPAEPGKISQVSLSVSNVSRDLIDYIRSLTVPMLVNIYEVSESEPNTAFAEFPTFVWRNLTYNASTIVGTLSMENFLSEPYPADLMAPYNFPGLFS